MERRSGGDHHRLLAADGLAHGLPGGADSRAGRVQAVLFVVFAQHFLISESKSCARLRRATWSPAIVA